MSRRVGLRCMSAGGGKKKVLLLSPPTKDSDVNENLPYNNYGDATHLIIMKKSPELNYRILLEFDISSVPAGAEILSAELRLRASSQSGYPMTQVVSRIVGAWTEMGVTWLNQPAVTTLHQLTIEVSAAIEWKKYDVTEMTKDARAIGDTVGFRIKHTVEGGSLQDMNFHSKESEWIAYHPVLEVVYV